MFRIILLSVALLCNGLCFGGLAQSCQQVSCNPEGPLLPFIIDQYSIQNNSFPEIVFKFIEPLVKNIPIAYNWGGALIEPKQYSSSTISELAVCCPDGDKMVMVSDGQQKHQCAVVSNTELGADQPYIRNNPGSGMSCTIQNVGSREPIMNGNTVVAYLYQHIIVISKHSS